MRNIKFGELEGLSPRVAQVLNWPAALATMAVVCCLCHVDLSSGVASKKKKEILKKEILARPF